MASSLLLRPRPAKSFLSFLVWKRSRTMCRWYYSRPTIILRILEFAKTLNVTQSLILGSDSQDTLEERLNLKSCSYYGQTFIEGWE